MTKAHILLLLLLSALLIFNAFSSASPLEASSDLDEEYDEDADEDLKFLLQQENNEQSESFLENEEGDEESESSLENGGDENDTKLKLQDQEKIKPSPEFDEKDVLVLKATNFTSFVKNNPYVMVQFYVPHCTPCEALAREFAAAATILRGEVVFAKVNATQEKKLTKRYQVQFMPSVYFFFDGLHKPYSGKNIRDAIVSWTKKRTGTGAFNVTSLEEAERVLNTEKKFVLGFLDSLVGEESAHLGKASRCDDEINFYQTDNPDVAKFFNMDPTKRPALILVKKDDEECSHHVGKFTKSAITKFVKENKSPLVIPFNEETAPSIFGSNIKKQIFLFGTPKITSDVLPIFKEAAMFFRGKLTFVYLDLDNKAVATEASQFFGIKGDSPQLVAFSTESEEGRKYKFNGEITLESIKVFGEEFLADKIIPYLKSEPVPENNNGDIKIVVGVNFDEIVLDELKDVLLEIYAPGCDRCQALEPTYNKLAKYLRGIDSLVIAKMDGTSNDHPSLKIGGFPTFLFFPADNKKSSPINFEKDLTIVGFYKFLKQNAKTPFKLQRPTSDDTVPTTPSSNSKLDELQLTYNSDSDTIISNNTQQSNTKDTKDEL
ncbi:protein disulfide-isomerase [Ranunculus cassubicifolius]